MIIYDYQNNSTDVTLRIYCIISLLISIMFVIFLVQEKFSGVDIRVRVNGGGHVAQIYAIRQAISKALVAYYQKCKY